MVALWEAQLLRHQLNLHLNPPVMPKTAILL
jgi:hypothetical protein